MLLSDHCIMSLGAEVITLLVVDLLTSTFCISLQLFLEKSF